MATLDKWRVFSLITESPDSPGGIFPRDLLIQVLKELFEMELSEYPSDIFNTQIEKILLDGNLPLLQYVNKKTNLFTHCNSEKADEFDFKGFYIHAAKNGRLNIIIYLHKEIKLTADNRAVNCAAINGRLEILKYLHEEMGLTGEGYNVDWAADNNQLEIIKYMHEKMKLVGSNNAIRWAAGNGYLNLVIYLHEKMDLTVGEYSFTQAVIKGYLPVVKYLHEEMGLASNDRVIKLAIKYDKTEMANYLKSIMPSGMSVEQVE